MEVLERPRQAQAATPDDEVITSASVAAAQVVLDNMTPTERAAMMAGLHARWDREQTRRQDFALHLQIKASPRQWL